MSGTGELEVGDEVVRGRRKRGIVVAVSAKEGHDRLVVGVLEGAPVGRVWVSGHGRGNAA